LQFSDAQSSRPVSAGLAVSGAYLMDIVIIQTDLPGANRTDLWCGNASINFRRQGIATDRRFSSSSSLEPS